MDKRSLINGLLTGCALGTLIALGMHILHLEVSAPLAQAITQCNDGIDNDNDGTIDFPRDLGCSSATG
jgi:hypothetical protein